MKLYELEHGDMFRLAGDDDSPVFTVLFHSERMSCFVKEQDGTQHEISGFAPVLHIQRGN